MPLTFAEAMKSSSHDVGPLHSADVVIPSDPAEARVVQDRIEQVLQERQTADRDIFSIKLALEEALVNAIKHGHRGDPSKQVHVRYRVEADRLTVEVEDQGPGFRPELVPDPRAPENLERDCGRGLLLMRNFMTSVRYNDAGTCVTLCKCRAGG